MEKVIKKNNKTGSHLSDMDSSAYMIKSSLPLVGLFGNDMDDEFTLHFENQNLGVFKSFEFPSLMLSRDSCTSREIINRSVANGTTFSRELEGTELLKKLDEESSLLVERPNFALQLFRDRLGRAFMMDTALSRVFSGIDGEGIEFELAKFIYAWNKLEDFYCIEGLVGGTGERNPFKNVNGPMLSDENLDTIDDILPYLYRNIDENAKKAVSIQLASTIERDFKDVNSGIEVLAQVYKDRYGDVADPGIVAEAMAKIARMPTAKHDTAKSVARFTNSMLRFYNWLPQLNGSGSMYDSLCVPINSAINILKDKHGENADVLRTLSGITDATSPKGIALARLVLMGKLGSTERLAKELERVSTVANSKLDQEILDMFAVLDADDSVFYESLTGGKWKGIKQLSMFKKIFGAEFDIPKGFVISSIAVKDILKKEGMLGIIENNRFTFSEEDRHRILRMLDSADFGKHLDLRLKPRLERMADSLIARSSMDFEDGRWTFSGTYDSVQSDKSNLYAAVRAVVKSWFGTEGIKDRESIGLAHIPNIAVLVQEKIDCDFAGVMNILNGKVHLSLASTPDQAVNGMGSTHTWTTVEEAMSTLNLKKFTADFAKLHEVFGDIDVEFGVVGEHLYIFQMRPKTVPSDASLMGSVENNENIDTVVLKSADELDKAILSDISKVRLLFLDGNENMMNIAGTLVDFIRRNRQNIYWIEGGMPSVAHIPNKIEGFFGIRYKQIDSFKRLARL